MSEFCNLAGTIVLVAIVAACVPTQTSTPSPPTNAQARPAGSGVASTSVAKLMTESGKPDAPRRTATPSPPKVLLTAENSPERIEGMKLQITLEDTVLTATLYDSQTTRDFMTLLPLSLTLEDYAGTEKVSDLPRRLTTEGAPAGSDPSVGDITYYAPWGNLAIFYRDFGYASGLITLGKLEGSIEALDVPGSVRASIELIE